MRSYRAGDAPTGALVTPHEAVAEMDALASTYNALDRDNIPAAVLTSAQTKLGAVHRIKSDFSTTTRARSHAASSVAAEFPIPDDAGNPWVIEHFVNDGLLRLSLFCTLQTEQPIWVGVRVNGAMVIRSPWRVNRGDYDSFHIVGTTPVPSGTARIEPVYTQIVDHGSTPALTWSTSFEHRRVTILEIMR